MKRCPNCPDQGWWEDRERFTGDPIQVQCEFCECEPDSVFNVIRNLEHELDELKTHNDQLQSLLSTKEVSLSKIKADAVRGYGEYLIQVIPEDGFAEDVLRSLNNVAKRKPKTGEWWVFDSKRVNYFSGEMFLTGPDGVPIARGKPLYPLIKDPLFEE